MAGCVFFAGMNNASTAIDTRVENQLKLNESHSIAIRIWHWVTFLTISASLVTVLLASTIYTTSGNTEMVKELMKEKGGSANKDQAWAVAHEFSDKLWMLHKYIGYGLAFLLLTRIIIEFAQPSTEKLKSKFSRMLKFRFTNSEQKTNRTHYLWVQSGYLIFYFLILVMALTGLGLAYEDVPFFKNIHEPLMDIHEIFQYGIYIYILTHITGVILAETTRFPGMVSRMIGKKRN